MKKLFITLLIVVGFTLTTQAQFGVKAGIDFATAKAKGFSSESETGFFVGVFTSFELSDKVKLQPELLYVDIKDLELLSLPVLAKFSVAESFNLLVGPSLNYFLDADDEEFQLNLEFGASYDIANQFELNAKYTYMLKDDWRLNGFFVGLGYRFN